MKPGETSFLQNEVLFGRNSAAGIVAVEPVAGDQMRVFRREKGKLTSNEQGFRPFLWVTEAALMQEFQGKHEIEELTGNGALRYLVWFNSWKDFLAARKRLNFATGKNPSDPAAPFFILNDPVQQFLMQTGQTFFKGVRFEDLHRLQLDIETDCAEGYEFSNPQRESDRILCVALTDNRGWEHFIAHEDEAKLLAELVAVIQERDPDRKSTRLNSSH